jgi:hypothetical protein
MSELQQVLDDINAAVAALRRPSRATAAAGDAARADAETRFCDDKTMHVADMERATRKRPRRALYEGERAPDAAEDR